MKCQDARKRQKRLPNSFQQQERHELCKFLTADCQKKRITPMFIQGTKETERHSIKNCFLLLYYQGHTCLKIVGSFRAHIFRRLITSRLRLLISGSHGEGNMPCNFRERLNQMTALLLFPEGFIAENKQPLADCVTCYSLDFFVFAILKTSSPT